MNVPIWDSAKSLGAKWKARDAGLPDYTVQRPIGWFASGANAAFYGIQATGRPGGTVLVIRMRFSARPLNAGLIFC